MTHGLAETLGGCGATLSGWHVPRERRHVMLPPDAPAQLRLAGSWLEHLDRYEDAPDQRPRCLCGWKLTEDALLSLLSAYEEAVALDPDGAHRYVALTIMRERPRAD